jgi:hypothetical protein
LLAVALFLFASSAAFGFPPSGAFAGIGPEANGHTRNSLAFGGGLISGFDLNPLFSIGQKTAYFHDTGAVGALELQGFFRFYPPVLRWLNSDSGPFLQAEAGGAVFLYEGGAFPSFSGGLTAGWRFYFNRNWYAEPFARGGYPYIWGAGVTAGLRIMPSLAPVFNR